MAYQCRICLENDTLKNLISPCRCSGNSKFVHYKCIEQWRKINISNHKYHTCEVCNGKYDITPKKSLFWWFRFISYIMFIMIQIAQILLCMMVYKVNKNGLIMVWVSLVASGIFGFYCRELKPMLARLLSN